MELVSDYYYTTTNDDIIKVFGYVYSDSLAFVCGLYDKKGKFINPVVSDREGTCFSYSDNDKIAHGPFKSMKAVISVLNPIQFKIIPNNYYITANGDIVKILTQFPDQYFANIGIIRKGSEWKAGTWSKEGAWNNSNIPHDNDLTEGPFNTLDEAEQQ